MEFSTSKCKVIKQCTGLKSIQESKLAIMRVQLSSYSCLVAFSKEKTAGLKVPHFHDEDHRSVSVWSQASPHPLLTLFLLRDVRGKKPVSSISIRPCAQLFGCPGIASTLSAKPTCRLKQCKCKMGITHFLLLRGTGEKHEWGSNEPGRRLGAALPLPWESGGLAFLVLPDRTFHKALQGRSIAVF